MRFDCIERRVANLFGHHARVVVRHPWPFIVIPILVSITLSVGFIRHSGAFIKDELELYTPTDAPAHAEYRQLDRLFHINDSDPFYSTRRYDARRAGYILVTGDPDGSDILNPLVMHAAMQLWTVVQSLTVEDRYDRRVSYPAMCVKFPLPEDISRTLAAATAVNGSAPSETCVSNPLLEAFKFMLLSRTQGILPAFNGSLEDISITHLTGPFTTDGLFLAHLLGGITLDSAKRIVGAKAIMLPYALRHGTKQEDMLAEKWELQLANFLLEYNSPAIRIAWWTHETLASESSRDRDQLVTMLAPMFFVVTVFTVACCCVGSWVRSRPWLAVGGVLSAGMAIVSGVGLLLLLGFKFTSVAYSMPFIVFSIGVDNVFILLSAWRMTSERMSLVERTVDTFRDAGVSITVTSLTDAISFGVGCMTTFPSVQMFCVYAVVAVAFVYVYQLTFFAGIMVLTSRREVAGRHCLTFRLVAVKGRESRRRHDDKQKKIKAEKQNKSLSTGYWTMRNHHHKKAALPSSAFSDKSIDRHVDESFDKNHWMARFFRTTYADFLLNPVARIFVITAFIAYLGISMWGCSEVKLGLEPNDLLPDDSYAKRTLMMQEKYFTEYGSFLHVWMYNLSSIDTTRHRRIWIALEREIELYEHTEFTAYSDSWLRTFMAFVNSAGLLITPENFVFILRNVFLSQPQYAKYTRDIRFDDTGGRLEATRFPVQLRYVGPTNQSRAMHLFRRLAATSDLPTGVYADFFQFAEQYNAVLPGTLASIACAGGAVILVSLILIPKPTAAIWVSMSIVSINVGILGLMTFWSVRLDFISMVTIVMSIGFCVDFSAHLAYNFSKGSALTAADRMRNALYAVGTPILQSGASTILGVSFMVTVDSYVFRSFLKTVILVILLGAIHGLVILPVLLTLLFCPQSGDLPDGDDTTSTADGTRTSPSGASGNSRTRHPNLTDSLIAARGGSINSSLPSVSTAVHMSYGQLGMPLAVAFESPPVTSSLEDCSGPAASAHHTSSGPLRPKLPSDWGSRVIAQSGGHRRRGSAADAYVYHNPTLDTLR